MTLCTVLKRIRSKCWLRYLKDILGAALSIDRDVAAKQSLLTYLSTRRTLTYPKKIFKRRLIERQWLIVRIE